MSKVKVYIWYFCWVETLGKWSDFDFHKWQRWFWLPRPTGHGTYSKNVYLDTSIELRDENPNMICVWDFLFFQCSIVEFHVTSDANEELKSCKCFVSITAFWFASLLFWLWHFFRHVFLICLCKNSEDAIWVEKDWCVCWQKPCFLGATHHRSRLIFDWRAIQMLDTPLIQISYVDAW